VMKPDAPDAQEQRKLMSSGCATRPSGIRARMSLLDRVEVVRRHDDIGAKAPGAIG